ncbi:MAG: purine-binding chemotaxis protein CheW [Dehalococcoidales bacterium]|nr:purine-binding chemotaxis protein CheW [Dehalococcoidales bacterium]
MTNDAVLNEKQVAIFELNGETYGLDIGMVHEIIQMQPITRVPKAPFFVEGVINLRGKVIPVIDMGKRFGLDKVERTKNNRIVVVDINGTTIGIIVDAVTEVLRISNSAVETVSSVVTAGDADYLQGIAKIGDRMIILLELGKMLSKDSMFTEISASQRQSDSRTAELAAAGKN